MIVVLMVPPVLLARLVSTKMPRIPVQFALRVLIPPLELLLVQIALVVLGPPKELLAQVLVQAAVLVVPLAQAAAPVTLALQVTTRMVEIHAQNVLQALMPLLETLVVLLVALLNGQQMELEAAQIV